MSNTAINAKAKQAAASLPAPRIKIQKLQNGQKYDIGFVAASQSSLESVTVRKTCQATVYGIPEEIMKNLSKYQLQLELLRYANGKKSKAGYKHPSNVASGLPLGGRTHGGMQNVSGTLSLRQSEWAVTNYGQVIDVTSALFGYMFFGEIRYRDNTGNLNVIEGIYPFRTTKTFGKRFAYSRLFTPARFRFRWSVLDLTDARKQRIFGPVSDVVTVSSLIFPFIPDLPIAAGPYAGSSTASINAKYDPRLASMWIGDGRLP
jgi:hypothetical protein